MPGNFTKEASVVGKLPRQCFIIRIEIVAGFITSLLTSNETGYSYKAIRECLVERTTNRNEKDKTFRFF